MSNTSTLLSKLTSGGFDTLFKTLYGDDSIDCQRTRYIDAIHQYTTLYGEEDDLWLFSAPGRTEIGGNHTDHNHGLVLAGSVNLDIIAVVAPTKDGIVRVNSYGFDPDIVDLSKLSIVPNDKNRSASLIRGIADRFTQLDYAVGGFRAYTTSQVLKGSGLSSSAAFEVLIGTIFNHLYNKRSIDAIEIAKIAQYAEVVHFGKPCGLMDQLASAVGGIIMLDLADSEKPMVRKIAFDFSTSKHRLCVVDVGDNHADLTHEYANITTEMQQISRELGVSFLREATYEKLLPKISHLRSQCGDRAILRALHFLSENERVIQQADALESGDFEAFKTFVLESGHSSFEYLQNISASSAMKQQGAALALALAQQVLNGKGAWRIHGGGFGGTTQNFVPNELVSEFVKTMETVFGEGCCHTLTIRPVGGICIC